MIMYTIISNINSNNNNNNNNNNKFNLSMMAEKHNSFTRSASNEEMSPAHHL